jgi:hypothetical protein
VIGWDVLGGALLVLSIPAGIGAMLDARRQRLRRGLLWAATGAAAILLTAQALLLILPPRPKQQMLFEGVTYVRDRTGPPQRAVVHLVRVDLTTEGVEVLVTPPDAPGDAFPYRARRTTGFLREFGVQIAVNGGHFVPSPEASTGVRLLLGSHPVSVMGLVVSESAAHGRLPWDRPALAVTDEGRVVLWGRPDPSWRSAVTGMFSLVEDGSPGPDAVASSPEPMTAVGADATGRVLFLAVVEGRQPRRSPGLDRERLAALLLRHGVHDAMTLDGGGSSTLAVSAPFIGGRLLSRPVHLGLPGLERPVGNHIGIRAPPAGREAAGEGLSRLPPPDSLP